MNKLPIYVEGILDKSIVSNIIDLISKQSNYKIKRENFFIDQTNGITEVFKKLNKSKTTCIGFIDNDKRKSNSFNNSLNSTIIRRIIYGIYMRYL